MIRCYQLVALLALLLFEAPLYAGNNEHSFAKKQGDALQSNLIDADFASDTIFITKLRMQRTYMPPTAVAKKPGHYTIADWRSAIDSTWGPGLPKAQKLNIFDTFWGTVDRQFACFNGIEVNWDSIGNLYRNEIVNGDPTYGVSRGRFDAIMNHLALALKESHTDAEDLLIYQTALVPGVPVMVVGWFGGDNGHFGAGLTPLPDSSLLVYRVVPNHPLGLERGDIVLGYDRIPWKQLYHELLDAELPMAFLFWGSCPTAYEHSFLMAAGLNWHLFDTLDVVKYGTGDTLHLSVAPLIGQDMHLICSEQMDIPGVPMPNTDVDQWVSYGIVEGTQIGHIYGRAWSNEQVGDQFHEAIQDLVENHQTSGLIIDFRTNYGGLPIFANDGLSYLFNAEKLTIDEAFRCNEQDHLALCPEGIYPSAQVTGRASPIYDRPVAVLTGPGAVSAGDDVALFLKFLSTSRFFGKGTATAFNTPLTIGGFSDWYMRYPKWNEYIVDEPGQYLTHRGFAVDDNVWLTRDGVTQGRDDVVGAAIAWINSAQGNEPAQSFDPSNINMTVAQGQIANGGLNIQNNGNWPLLYSLTPQTSNLPLISSEGAFNISAMRKSSTKTLNDESSHTSNAAGSSDPPVIAAHGGFDNFGHIWMDSDQPHGPSYDWVDITGNGTYVFLGDDDWYGPVDLGFNFAFYDSSYSGVSICSNGLLVFGDGTGDPNNSPIPSPNSPNNYIAPFWSDLVPLGGGGIYCLQDTMNHRFIVSFIEVPYYGPVGSLTFQAILHADGKIDFNYGRMNQGGQYFTYYNDFRGVFSSIATIGIENADGSDGLQVAYYENYMHDSLSISIYPSWLAVAPASGHIMPGGSETATVSFRAGNLGAGTYTGNVFLESNDPVNPSITIPVTMEVEGGCSYVPGDINNNGTANGIDIVYAVSYLKGTGNLPPVDCGGICPETSPFYAAGDVNGNCAFNGLDITYFVRYLKLQVPSLLYCADCPPADLVVRGNTPVITPSVMPAKIGGAKGQD
jgi:hypothetical protein